MIQLITWKTSCDWIKAVLSVKVIKKKIYDHENHIFIGVKRHAYIPSKSQNFEILSLPFIFIIYFIYSIILDIYVTEFYSLRSSHIISLLEMNENFHFITVWNNGKILIWIAHECISFHSYILGIEWWNIHELIIVIISIDLIQSLKIFTLFVNSWL